MSLDFVMICVQYQCSIVRVMLVFTYVYFRNSDILKTCKAEYYIYLLNGLRSRKARVQLIYI